MHYILHILYYKFSVGTTNDTIWRLDYTTIPFTIYTYHILYNRYTTLLHYTIYLHSRSLSLVKEERATDMREARQAYLGCSVYSRSIAYVCLGQYTVQCIGQCVYKEYCMHDLVEHRVYVQECMHCVLYILQQSVYELVSCV